MVSIGLKSAVCSRVKLSGNGPWSTSYGKWSPSPSQQRNKSVDNGSSFVIHGLKGTLLRGLFIAATEEVGTSCPSGWVMWHHPQSGGLVWRHPLHMWWHDVAQSRRGRATLAVSSLAGGEGNLSPAVLRGSAARMGILYWYSTKAPCVTRNDLSA